MMDGTENELAAAAGKAVPQDKRTKE